MNITDWIEATAAIISALAAIGALFFSKQARDEAIKIKASISNIENHSTVFNMGDNHGASITAGKSIVAGGDISAGSHIKKS